MNILFLTQSTMEDINTRGIYTDLVRELDSRGVNLYIVCPREKRTKLPTELSKAGNMNVLRVKTGNLTKTKSFIEKGISTLLIEFQYLRAIKENFMDIDFDLIMYSTPPITFNRIIKHYGNKHKVKTYLMLKDIFPQNAVDIWMMKKGGILYRLFRKKEKELYRISDHIGCMSQGNLDYVQKHNPFVDPQKLEIFPNAIKPLPKRETNEKNSSVRKHYNIPVESVLFVYGGNLGKPQGIDFLLEAIENFYRVGNGHLLIVGSGTEYDKIKTYIESHRPEQVSLIEKLPKKEYDQLMESADVGLIFLDKRFTIPNFPSRLLSYMENGIPVLAATDKNTDIKDVLQKSHSGLWCESVNVQDFIKHAQILAKDSDLRSVMGTNGRQYLEDNYCITDTVNILLKHLDKVEDHVQR